MTPATPAVLALHYQNEVLHADGNKALDYEFVLPGGVAEKLWYVFASHLFERIVLPSGLCGDAEVNALFARLAERNQARSRSGVAPGSGSTQTARRVSTIRSAGAMALRRACRRSRRNGDRAGAPSRTIMSGGTVGTGPSL